MHAGEFCSKYLPSIRKKAWLRNGCPVCSSMWAFSSHTAVLHQPLIHEQCLPFCSSRGLCCLCKSSLHRKPNPRNIQGKCFQNSKGSPLAKKECWNKFFNTVYWAKSTSDFFFFFKNSVQSPPWLWSWDLQRNPKSFLVLMVPFYGR